MQRKNGNVVDLDAYRAEKKRRRLPVATDATEHKPALGLFGPEHFTFTLLDTAFEPDEPPRY